MTIQTELQKIRERVEKATHGPWYKDRDFPEVKLSHTRFIAISEGSNPKCQEDSQFIAHARTDIPRLLACVERLVEGLRWIDQSHASINGEDYTDLEFEMVTRASKALLDASAILTGSNEKEIDNGQLL